MDKNFTWVPLFEELAKKLLIYKDNRAPLVEWIYEELGMVTRDNGNSLVSYLHMRDGSRIVDIDPFSVFGIFNRNIRWENRTALLEKFKEHFSLEAEIPTDFNGIPTLDPRRAFFFSWGPDNDVVIRNLWVLYEKVIKGEDIEEAFNRVLEDGCMPKYSLTMTLFWISPSNYISLDSRNREYLSTIGLPDEFPKFNYSIYRELLDSILPAVKAANLPINSFMDFSDSAWIAATNSPRIWMFSGNNNNFNSDILAIGSMAKGKLDFSKYKTQEELGKAYREAVGNKDSKIPHAYWDFIKNVKIGDLVVVFSNHGKSHMLYGWGRFNSECSFVRGAAAPVQRSVEWHLPLPESPAEEKHSKNQMFFHCVEGITADNIMRLLNISYTDDIVTKDPPASSPMNYWTYSPGVNASKWQMCIDEGIMCIGWDELGDLSQYTSREDMNKAVKQFYPSDGSAKNDTLAVWQFAYEMKPGDIVFAKKGRNKIIGRGVVESEYMFDDSMPDFKHVRKVTWTNIGEWDTDDMHALKTLTNVTRYQDYIETLEKLFEPGLGKEYWWLNANPKYWKVDTFEIGEMQKYTAYNKEGNKRQVFKYFKAVKPGDMLVCYETNPTKKVKALCEIIEGLHEDDGNEVFNFVIREKVACQIPWSELIKHDVFKKSEPYRAATGSLYHLNKDEYDFIVDITKVSNGNDFQQPDSPEAEYNSYSFEKDPDKPFIAKEEFFELVNQLHFNKNIILQGAPGVGKSFLARKVAYQMMEEENDSHIAMVQFHQ